MNSEDEAEQAPPGTTWPGYLLGVYALLCGLSAMVSAHVYPAGWAVITRPALCFVGLTAGLLLILRVGWWKPLMHVWLLAQAPILIPDLGGPMTWQSGLEITMIHYGHRGSTGPVLLDYSGYGVNFGPLVVLIITWVVMAKKWYPVGGGKTLFRLGALVEIVFLLAVVGGGTYAYWRWARPWLKHGVVMMIDSPPPGASVYLKDKFLGVTPLAITQQDLVDWGLSKPGSSPKCAANSATLGDGLLLSGPDGSAVLSFSPPAWLADDYVLADTPWGTRGVTILRHYYPSNYWPVPLLSKHQPGIVLDRPTIDPTECKPGAPIKLAIQLWRNPADPRITWGTPPEPDLPLQLSVLFWKQLNSGAGTYSATNFDLPAEWSRLATGITVSNVLTTTAPLEPGTYVVRLICHEVSPTNTPVNYSFLPNFSFGVLNVKR